MKINLPLTGQESIFSDQVTIVSTTDLKGITTHINQDFLDASGFSEDDLLGKNHNVVRHPDMPSAAFADLWQTLKKGESWIGIVNNRCKNGDHYWVDAFVGPVRENGKVVGYQSVRHKPDHADVKQADTLYKKINSGKLGRWAFSSIGHGNKIFLGMFATMGTSLGLVSLLNPISWVAASTGLVAGAILAFAVARALAKPLEQAAKASHAIINNPIARLVYSGRTDEIGQLQVALTMQQSRVRTLLGRVDDAAQNLIQCAETTAATAEMSSTGLTQQRSETEQVATALQEMSATAREVTNNINDSARAAHDASEESSNIKLIVTHAIGSISNLENEIATAMRVIKRLEQDSDAIGSVLDVIRGIAEQTNLLALNAAIEAARAGEQGRGFAVVADEVRTLAGRTADATQEIQAMIETLQSGSRAAVQAMQDAAKCSEDSVEHVGETAESLATITASITTISNMSAQISAAAEQQIIVVEEIERNATNISMAVEQAAEGVNVTASEGIKLSNLAMNLQSVAHQCG
jgi:aerotaxis receptor